MRSLARCALAALLAAAFAAPVYAAPPLVAAPSMVPTSVVFPALVVTPPLIVSLSGRAPMVRIPADPPETVADPPPAPTPVRTTVADAKAYALRVLAAAQYRCLNSIIAGESKWDPTVWNAKGSGAYGLGQAKPASKMAPYGADYMTSPLTQVKFVIGYVTTKYGSACGAAAWRAAHGWY